MDRPQSATLEQGLSSGEGASSDWRRGTPIDRLAITDTGVGYPALSGEGLVCLYGGGKLVDSTVTGSTTVDIVTFKRPKLVNSTSGTSRQDPSGVPWGVCTND
jgi:hypothetical protein